MHDTREGSSQKRIHEATINGTPSKLASPPSPCFGKTCTDYEHELLFFLSVKSLSTSKSKDTSALSERTERDRTVPHTYYISRHLSDSKIPQNLSKIENVAETCEFDGKEPLFVERTIAISITPVAGLIFQTKNRQIFLERFFWREITAREQVSRAVILENF